jgi:hypothetical protein
MRARRVTPWSDGSGRPACQAEKSIHVATHTYM